MRTLMIFGLLGCLLALTGCGPRADLTEQDNNRTITVKVGEEFVVGLRGGTSLTKWRYLASAGNGVQIVGREDYVGDNGPNYIGGEGTFYYRFQAAKTGVTTLTFKYIDYSEWKHSFEDELKSVEIWGVEDLNLVPNEFVEETVMYHIEVK